MTSRLLAPLLAALAAGCAGSTPPATRPEPAQAPPMATAPVAARDVASAGVQPILPPAVAFMSGLMPLKSTGVERFGERHPTYDGRGVLIGILDTGLDPGVEGLITTSTGAPKVVELRDFSGEGRLALTPVTPSADGTVSVAERSLAGAGRIARLTATTTWYAGQLSELPLGKPPAADLNGDGTNTDVFPVVVVRAVDGWVAFIDSNLNGSFEDEMPLHDYRLGRETIALGTKPITIVANFGDTRDIPTLDLVFDNGGHGTHVAGIAAGHNLFSVTGFDGVAPGAQIIGLKIANSARGGVSVNGSMQRAMEYAARYAAQRNLPLVLNLSFGVGNEFEGRAVIDSIVNAFLVAHPDVVFTISAGNDGPGLSSLGFPGSADLALTVGATLPGPLAPLRQQDAPQVDRDVLESFSSRGAEAAKPDVVAPGWAFSSVPRWDTGHEIKPGTSFAAPHVAGLVARLVSAMLQEGRKVSAAEVAQALRVSATRLPGETVIDQGAGVPQLEAAYRWLLSGHQGSQYVARTAGGGSAAFRRDGLAGPSDTLQVFRVRHVGGLRAAQFLLRSSVPWLSVPGLLPAGARESEIAVVYSRAAFSAPGVYIGSVIAWNPSDTLAGPLFTLPNTVVVPYDLASKPLYDERRAIGPARVRRYFLRVARPGATLVARVTLPDSATQSATARLYEPSGQPFRDADDVPMGRDDPGTAQFVVRAEDLVPGVYELDVVAPPLSGVTATVRADMSALALADAEARNAGAASASGRLGTTLLGAEGRFEVTGRGAPAESLVVRVPQWATRAVVDVQMPREQWNEFTDFGVTDFDSTGQQLAQGPLNYAFGRHGFSVPAGLQGHPLTIELFPAFARAQGAHPWRATVRVRFLLREGQPFGGGSDVSVVAGGRAGLTVGRVPEVVLPEGFAPLVELRVQAPVGLAADAVRRVVVRP
ncbi:MAG: S8 family serine peptidase [Gemmatimonadales bacterium]